MPAKIPDNLIIEDIKTVIERTGSTKFKDYQKNGKYSSYTVARVVGSWTSFLKKEGYTNNFKRLISKKELVEDVERVFKDTGITKQENYLKHGRYSKAVIKRIFGSWNKMLNTLGYQVNMLRPGQYTKEDILDEYNRLKNDIGHPLSAKEFRELGRFSQIIVDKMFGSFTNMKRELGERIDARFLSNKELEEDIMKLYKTYGILTQDLIEEESIVSYPTILARYGSIENLCKKINIPYDPLKNKSKLLIQCLTVIKEILGDDYKTEKTFPWLRNPVTNHPLFIDIFYPKLNLAIKIDGGQHFTTCFYAPTEEDLSIIQARDRAKDKALKEHGYKIVRIAKPTVSYIKEKLKDVI